MMTAKPNTMLRTTARLAAAYSEAIAGGTEETMDAIHADWVAAIRDANPGDCLVSLRLGETVTVTRRDPDGTLHAEADMGDMVWQEELGGRFHGWVFPDGDFQFG